MLDDILPVRRVVVAAQVGLELATENLQSGTLSDTVRSNQTQHLSRPRHGQTVKLEGVRAISMGDLTLEVGGQVDDGDGVEGALLGADTATDTEGLRDEGKARGGRNFDAELSATDNGTRLLAFLTTLSRATLHGWASSVLLFAWWGRRGCFRGREVMVTDLVVVDDGDTLREMLADDRCVDD